ncbi:MAG: pilus assembly protein PilM [Pseudomonadota bacterium]
MAQKLKAVDLGSWSLKVVTLNRTLVGTGVAGVEEHPMASRTDGKGRDREAWKLLREIFGERKLAGEAVTVGYPGERVLNRRIEVPFTDRSKVDQILPFELEQHVPFSADDIVGDYVMNKARKSRTGADLFVSVVPRVGMEELLAELDSAKLDPRVIGHSMIAMSKLEALVRSSGSNEPMLLVDLGHTKTLAVLVLNGTILGVRSILRGGMTLTRRIAKGLGVDMEEAERIKHAAHLFPAGQGEVGEGRTHEVAAWLQEELAPVARDLKLLLRTAAPEGSTPVHIFGGGARLGGLPEFLTAEIGRRTEVLDASQLKMAIPSDLDDPGVVPTLALALDSVRGGDGDRINFRRLAFPYVGDFRNLRGRLAYLAVLVFLMVVAFITPSFLKFQAMSEMNETLEAEILALSEEILGEPLADYDEALAAFEGVPGAESWIVYPDMTGLEAFYEVEAVVASIDGTGVEGAVEEPMLPEIAPEPELSPEEFALRELEGELPSPDEIEPLEPAAPRIHGLKMNTIVVDMTNETKGINGIVDFSGDCSSVATLELFETAVEKHPCFHHVVRSDQQVLLSDADRKGWQRFSLNFNIACPKEKDRKKETEGTPEVDGETPAPKAGEHGQVPGTPPPSPGPPISPPKADVPVPGAPVVGPEGPPTGETRDSGPEAPPTGAEGTEKPERPTAIDAYGPPHLDAPMTTPRARSAPLDRAGIPVPRTVERPVGQDLKRRIPSIRPGR